MEDLSAKLEKLLIEAEDCDLIGRLATDADKRELFKRLAADLRAMVRDIEAVIAGRTHKPP
jgi:predicted nuclease with TOPRIM domain